MNTRSFTIETEPGYVLVLSSGKGAKLTPGDAFRCGWYLLVGGFWAWWKQ